jgi:hypothetical protein
VQAINRSTAELGVHMNGCAIDHSLDGNGPPSPLGTVCAVVEEVI